MNSSMTSARLAVSAFLCAGCGPSAAEVISGDHSGESGAVVSSSSTSGTSTTPSLESSSTGGAECTEVVEGALLVNGETDLEWLATVREVSGQLNVIALPGSETLAEMRCLETVGGLFSVSENPELRSLSGMIRLKELGHAILYANPKLEQVGLDELESVDILEISGNPMLSAIGLPNVRVIRNLRLGGYSCPEWPEPDTVPVIGGDNPQLRGIDGLESLESSVTFVVSGQTGFVSTDRIVEISELLHEGGIHADSIRIRSSFFGNPNLPETEIARAFEAQGRKSYDGHDACENRDDNRICECHYP